MTEIKIQTWSSTLHIFYIWINHRMKTQPAVSQMNSGPGTSTKHTFTRLSLDFFPSAN